MEVPNPKTNTPPEPMEIDSDLSETEMEINPQAMDLETNIDPEPTTFNIKDFPFFKMDYLNLGKQKGKNEP